MKNHIKTPQNCMRLAAFLCLAQPAIASEQPRIATVRTGNALGDQEQAYLKKRLPKVKDALEKITGLQLTDAQVPRIAICTSGGGCRAALATLGWMQGMEVQPQKRGTLSTIITALHATPILSYLLKVIASWLGVQQPTQTPNNNIVEASPLSLVDATTYFSTLSGSAWAISGLQHSRMTPSHYLAHVSAQLTQPFLANIDVEEIAYEILEKYAYGQPISLIDIYGGILAHKFLHQLGTADESSITMDSYTSLADTAQSPLPIHAATIDDQGTLKWAEFTPYEVGSSDLNAFIPTWAFGRKFSEGISVDLAPAQSLGYAMGIWGSALSASAKEFFNLIVEPQLDSVTTNYLESAFGSIVAQAHEHFTSIHNALNKNSSLPLDCRLSPARVFNWTKGMPHAPMNEADTLTLIDAGMSINISVPPVLRPERAVDIIIIIDATRGMMKEEIVMLEDYAKAHALHMPTLDLDKVGQVCSVHKNPSDPLAPIVIYVPFIKNSGFNNDFDPQTTDFASTYKFNYTQEQIDTITGLAKYSMQQSQGIIIDVIKQWIALHA